MSKNTSDEEEGGNNTVQTTYGEIEEIHDDIQIYFMKFKRFDVFESPPLDHHFESSNNNSGCSSSFCKGSLMKKIREEWKIVKAQIPNDIFVRVYEETMDVMRVAVVAERESSYHHGLFFFDVRFPRAYPSKPPQLFYHSFGESQYSKNLHQKGKVRLGLFREWRKKFDSKKSAVLEVLVFIQRLVLLSPNSTNPNSDSYKKKVLMMKTCEAMLRMLRSPPKGFEAFVVGYFRTRAHRILMNFKSSVDISSDKDMRLLFFRVVKAFEKNGTYCKHHYNQQQYDQAFQEEITYVNPVNDDKVGCF